MKFKEIKPGMVIRCPTEEDARALLEYLEKEYSAEWGCRFNDKKADEWIKSGDDRCILIDHGGIMYGNTRFFKALGSSPIIEFSNLIESDSDAVPKIEWEFDLKEGCLKGKPVSDSPINSPTDSPTDSPMTAEELLEKFRNIDSDSEMVNIFGCTFAGLFDFLSNEEILECIEEYEAAKKAPKPVEVESGYFCEIYKCDDYYAFMESVEGYRLWGVTEEFAKNDVNSKAIKCAAETGEKIATNVCFICRVKESK